MWMSVFATFVVLPLSASAIIADMDVGLLFLISVTSLTVIAILLGGWTSNSQVVAARGACARPPRSSATSCPPPWRCCRWRCWPAPWPPRPSSRAQGGLPHEWFVFANPFAFACVLHLLHRRAGRGQPHPLRSARGRVRAGGRLHHRILRLSLRGVLAGRVDQPVRAGGHHLGQLPGRLEPAVRIPRARSPGPGCCRRWARR